MAISKKLSLGGALIVAFGLGVWTAPGLRNINPTPESDIDLQQVESAPPTDAGPTRQAPRAPRREPVRDRSADYAPLPTMEPSAAPVLKHVKPLLTWGTDTHKAAEGFISAEQFVTVVHAARNTQVPFILLKHRVLNEKQSLEQAIRASKPDLDAALEADRARLDARADLSRIGE